MCNTNVTISESFRNFVGEHDEFSFGVDVDRFELKREAIIIILEWFSGFGE